MKASKLYDKDGNYVKSMVLHPAKAGTFKHSGFTFNNMVKHLAKIGLFTKRNLPK